MSKHSTELFGEARLTYSPEGSPANPTAVQENGWERKTNATCGPRCVASFQRLPRPTSWVKTFAASLTGMEAWSSRRCALTWKLKGTRYGRAYFLLAVSAHPTVGTGFGLLLTPRAGEILEHPDDFKARKERNGYKNGTEFPNLTSQVVYGMLPTVKTFDANGQRKLDANGENKSKTTGTKYGVHLTQLAEAGMLPTPTAGEAEHYAKTYNPKSQMGRGLSAMAGSGMLPTPNAFDWNTSRSPEAWDAAKDKHGNVQNTLKQMATLKTLPTPTTSDYKGARKTETLHAAGRNQTNSLADTFGQSGKTSQLNPRFVAEMMGFPVNWTELPFQSGETNP